MITLGFEGLTSRSYVLCHGMNFMI